MIYIIRKEIETNNKYHLNIIGDMINTSEEL